MSTDPTDPAALPPEPEAPTLPDLVTDVVDVAQHLDQIGDQLDTLRRLAVAEDRSADAMELHAIADYLARSWSYARMAQTAVQALAAVQP